MITIRVQHDDGTVKEIDVNVLVAWEFHSDTVTHVLRKDSVGYKWDECCDPNDAYEKIIKVDPKCVLRD